MMKSALWAQLRAVFWQLVTQNQVIAFSALMTKICFGLVPISKVTYENFQVS